ncbi:hypothetical protein [Deinococcus radiophilus]|uniref:Uncharacterized protein n=1 Tax=Deinococcus radiophilus TaxID=32062 RepID=A0A3S0I3D7_9DEIO|nr:hypothetical protein [Deinococcus radiophilus]RTR26525.1 hypothetical protein EJ104_08235 [Deinococcus radiophilus]UFA50559.1 hypothetical protein LMT64_01175 [Deinococcus radiophilus]
MYRTFILLYVICLGGAALNHARDLWLGGWMPYTHASTLENAFWTSPTFIDLLIIALLLWRPR